MSEPHRGENKAERKSVMASRYSRKRSKQSLIPKKKGRSMRRVHSEKHDPLSACLPRSRKKKKETLRASGPRRGKGFKKMGGKT